MSLLSEWKGSSENFYANVGVEDVMELGNTKLVNNVAKCGVWLSANIMIGRLFCSSFNLANAGTFQDTSPRERTTTVTGGTVIESSRQSSKASPAAIG